jgi:hypothetical protein
MTALIALIERLHTATEGSRELDKAVWLACGHRVETIIEVGGHRYESWYEANGTRWALKGTHFTSSIDNALTLVPEGHGWGIIRRNSRHLLEKAKIYHATVDLYSDAPPPSPQAMAVGETHENAPLALCIASLRARMK